MEPTDLDAKIEDVLQRHDAVRLAYLFGSVAAGRAGNLSDVDVAVYLDESLSEEERFRLQLRLISELTGALKSNRIDLVIMNDVSISLNFEIIKANHLLFARDRDLKVEVEQRILSRYLDRRYYEKRWADEFLKKVAQKGV